MKALWTAILAFFLALGLRDSLRILVGFPGWNIGSTPATSQGHVAQMVERLPCKQGVAGSIPGHDLHQFRENDHANR